MKSMLWEKKFIPRFVYKNETKKIDRLQALRDQITDCTENGAKKSKDWTKKRTDSVDEGRNSWFTCGCRWRCTKWHHGWQSYWKIRRIIRFRWISWRNIRRGNGRRQRNTRYHWWSRAWRLRRSTTWIQRRRRRRT